MIAKTANRPKANPRLMFILLKRKEKKKMSELNIKYVNTKSLSL
tara:strand:- start:307 stop:438 length:132 start_codon:yes stop_codon:yes gene_type:complete